VPALNKGNLVTTSVQQGCTVSRAHQPPTTNGRQRRIFSDHLSSMRMIRALRA
jgi:hypothetical protein